MGSEMCIRDSDHGLVVAGLLHQLAGGIGVELVKPGTPGVIAFLCLLYTSAPADERSSVDFGGRRILKKKKNNIAKNL